MVGQLSTFPVRAFLEDPGEGVGQYVLSGFCKWNRI